MCTGLDMVRYYTMLNGKHREKDVVERKRKAVLADASETMTKRYVDLTDNKYCDSIYNYNMREDLRVIITRWRLSSHDLKIETGRRSGISRENRYCNFCDDCIEDESHVIFRCRAYEGQRNRFTSLLAENPDIKSLLNPQTKETATEVGKLLKAIEQLRNEIL